MSGTPQQGENALLAWLRERFGVPSGRVPVPIGDDMALLQCDGTRVAVTSDMLLDGVHFDTRRHGYAQIGRKALACSLSDCAGMCCEPRGATVSLALPRGMPLADIQQMYEGMAALGDAHGCAIIGGDTTSWEGRLAIDVVVLAEPMAPRGPVLRSGALPGDTLFVSGPLGGSILGRHLAFEPRLDVARSLAGRADVHAMMDISDGLALDLHRMCLASGCDAELEGGQLGAVVSAPAAELARQDGRTPLEHALSDGEDFELLVAGAPSLGGVAGLLPVGRVIARSRASSSLWMCGSAGRVPLEPRGYEHR